MPEICIVRFDINKYSVLSRRPRMRREGVARERQWLLSVMGTNGRRISSLNLGTPQSPQPCATPQISTVISGE